MFVRQYWIFQLELFIDCFYYYLKMELRFFFFWYIKNKIEEYKDYFFFFKKREMRLYIKYINIGKEIK